jgi:phage replication O-like protein O
MSNFIPNSFQVPNALVDEVIATLNPNALKCYLVVVRKTVGWQKEWDKISTTQLMKLTGIKKKDTVYNAMKELENLNLIECVKTQGKLSNYRLVLMNGTSTDKGVKVVPIKGTTTSTDKRDTTKDTIKTTNTKASSEAVYVKYTELLKASSSKQRSINNITKWLKEHTKEDLILAITNYNNVANRKYLKDCANFFGVSKESNGFFKDYISVEVKEEAYGGWS